MPPTGAMTVASASAFSLRRDLRVHRGHARARGVDLLRPRAGLHARRGFLAGAGTLLRAATLLIRHVPPRLRVVARLPRSGIGSQERLVALEVGLRVDSSASAAATSAAAAVACASACRMSSRREPACSSRSCASACARSARARAQRQLGVARVEARDQVALVDAVAFGDSQLEDASADFRRDLHVVGLDMAGDADAVLWRFVAAGRRRWRGRERAGGAVERARQCATAVSVGRVAMISVLAEHAQRNLLEIADEWCDVDRRLCDSELVHAPADRRVRIEEHRRAHEHEVERERIGRGRRRLRHGPA